MADKNWMEKASRKMEKKGTKGSFTSWCKQKGYNGVTGGCIEAGLNAGGKIAKKAQFAKAARSVSKPYGGYVGQEEMPAGGWISGGLQTLGGAALTLTGAGAGVGVPMMASGVGTMAQTYGEEQQMQQQDEMRQLQQSRQMAMQNVPQAQYNNPYASPYMMAMGGNVGSNVELEKGETYRTPQGVIKEVPDGTPSHAEGGQDMNLPPGTEVLGKLKASKDKRYKDLGRRLERAFNNYKKVLDGNPTPLAKYTAEKNLRNVQKEYSDLMAEQESKKNNNGNRKFAEGGETNKSGESGKNYLVSADETEDGDPKYPVDSKEDVKDAWHLRNHAKGLKISKETLKSRIRSKANDMGVDLPTDDEDEKATGGKEMPDGGTTGNPEGETLWDRQKNWMRNKYGNTLWDASYDYSLLNAVGEQFDIDALKGRPKGGYWTGGAGQFGPTEKVRSRGPGATSYYNPANNYAGQGDNINIPYRTGDYSPQSNQIDMSGLGPFGLNPLGGQQQSGAGQSASQSSSQQSSANAGSTSTQSGGIDFNPENARASSLSMQGVEGPNFDVNNPQAAPVQSPAGYQGEQPTPNTGFENTMGSIGNIAGAAAQFGPALYNIGRGIFGETADTDVQYQPNPYRQEILNLMEGRRANVQPQMRQANIASRSAQRNLRETASSPAQYLANLAGLQSQEQLSKSQIMSQKQRRDNEYRRQRAQMMASMGSQSAQRRQQLAGQNLERQLRSQAAQDRLLSAGLGQLGQGARGLMRDAGRRRNTEMLTNAYNKLIPGVDITEEGLFANFSEGPIFARQTTNNR